MIIFILDEMVRDYKLLIFYTLRKITEPALREDIWKQIMKYEADMLDKLITQEWEAEIEETQLSELEAIRDTLSDLE